MREETSNLIETSSISENTFFLNPIPLIFIGFRHAHRTRQAGQELSSPGTHFGARQQRC